MVERRQPVGVGRVIGPPPREHGGVDGLRERPLHVGPRGDGRDDDERRGPLLREPPPERARGVDVGDDPGERARRTDGLGQPPGEGLELGPPPLREVRGQPLVAERERAGKGEVRARAPVRGPASCHDV